MNGTLTATLTLRGTYSGGASGIVRGKAVLAGTYTRADTGGTGRVTGEGEWKGQVDGVLGSVQVNALWTDLMYEGLGMAPFALPPMRFTPLGSVPPPDLPVVVADARPVAPPSTTVPTPVVVNVPPPDRAGPETSYLVAGGIALGLIGAGIVVRRVRVRQ
ncbi:MAG: hypothetical protein K8U57_06890 [Planctomycetes bacterium]|nr:hypothetical protein [Planctomycetota bacterium]